MATVTLGCRFPRGLSIGIGGKTATLKPAQDCAEGCSRNEVDKELADAWLGQFAHHESVKNGMVFVMPEPVAQGQVNQTGPVPQGDVQASPPAAKKRKGAACP